VNCKPNTLVYIAKVIDFNDPWRRMRGKVDLRGTVLKITDLSPGTTMWIPETPIPCAGMALSNGRPKFWSGELVLIGDEYLRPFGDPDFNEMIETTKELTT
jgi:hypothetical protein